MRTGYEIRNVPRPGAGRDSVEFAVHAPDVTVYTKTIGDARLVVEALRVHHHTKFIMSRPLTRRGKDVRNLTHKRIQETFARRER